MSAEESIHNAELVPGFQGNPKRQATGLFKGVDFQVWLTVDAWITLDEEALLVVEGVEDFDVVKAASGITTQAKALSQPITLRSESVIEAIRNFWIAKHQNPTKAIEFRFVTTAHIGTEAGNPFGDGVAGLSLWTSDSERGHTESTEKLRQFLHGDPSTSAALGKALPAGVPSFVDFLRKSAAEQIYADLIRPIKWLADHAGVESAKEVARRHLQAFGEKMGLVPRDADKALPRLFQEVAERAFKEHRQLTRADFRMLFQDATEPTRRELADVTAMIRFAREQLGGLAVTPDGSSLRTEEMLSIVPSLPPICIVREALVKQLKGALDSAGFLALHGSTGKGKSTLAKILIQQIPGDWQWLNFRGLEPGIVPVALDRIARQLASGKKVHVVLDNIDVPRAHEARISVLLAAIARLALQGGSHLIITSQRELPGKFRLETEIQDDVFITIPPFKRDEIELLCRAGGCPEQDNRLHTTIVLAQTGGHPTLANAAVSTRKMKGWQAPVREEVLERPKEVKEEQQLARQLLGDLHPQDVELLYRLTLLSGPLRRDQAIAIGNIDPSIDRPADRFDQLVGPWIESAGGDYFRLSSLLSKAAEENWPAERIKLLRSAIGAAVLASGRLTLIEASEVLIQSLLIRDSGLASHVLVSLMAAPMKARPAISKELWWIITFSSDKPIFEENPAVSVLLRQLQFRIAVEGKSERVAELAERLFSEVENASKIPGKPFIEVLVYADLLLAADMLVPPNLLLKAWLKLKQTASENKELAKFFQVPSKRLPQEFVGSHSTLVSHLFGFILLRTGGVGYLENLVSALESLKEQDRATIIQEISSAPLRLHNFVDRVWIAEADVKPGPDWQKVIKGLRRGWEAGRRWELRSLIACCARGIAVVQDEYLGDAEAAHRTLNEAEIECGREDLLLRGQRGTVYMRQGLHEQAYKEWSESLGQWDTNTHETAMYALFAHSKCGMEATRIGKWKEAAEIFKGGRGVADRVGLTFEATAFGIDWAHALWRSGERRLALHQFGACLKELESLKPKPRYNVQTLWKTTEHIVRWCSLDAGAPGDRYELNVGGLCSESKEKERHDLVKDRPRAPMPLIWYFLGEAELYAGLGSEICNKLFRRPDRSTYPGPRSLIGYLELRCAFQTESFDELPLLCEEVALATCVVDLSGSDPTALFSAPQQAPEAAKFHNQIRTLMHDAFPSAILHVLARGGAWKPLVSAWRKSAARLNSGFNYNSEFDEIERVMTAANAEIRVLYQRTTENRLHRILSSLRLAIDSDSSLQACYVGCVSLAIDDHLLANIFNAGEALGPLVQRIWRQRIKFPVEFSTPRISIPAIEQACNDTSTGAQLAARILLAAQSAVHSRLPENMGQRLSQLATGS